MRGSGSVFMVAQRGQWTVISGQGAEIREQEYVVAHVNRKVGLWEYKHKKSIVLCSYKKKDRG
jgi:hypothetical protein